MCSVCPEGVHKSSSIICAEAKKKWQFKAKVDMELAGVFEEYNMWKVKDRPDGTCGWQWLKSLKELVPNVIVIPLRATE